MKRIGDVFCLLVGLTWVSILVEAVLGVFGVGNGLDGDRFLVACLAALATYYAWSEVAKPALRSLFPRRWVVLIEIREARIPEDAEGRGRPAGDWRVLSKPSFHRRKTAFHRAQAAADAWAADPGDQEARVWVGELDTSYPIRRHYKSLRRVRAA